MPSAENCIACRFHQEIDQGAQNALAFCPLKTRNTVQSKRLPLIDSLFIISEAFSFVKNFFKTFSKLLKQIFQSSNFSDRCLFRNSLFSISNPKPFVKNFFSFFSNLFSSIAAPLGDSFNRIPQGLPSCQQLFSFFCNLLQLRKKAPLLEPFYYCANRLYIRSMVTMACSPV